MASIFNSWLLFSLTPMLQTYILFWTYPFALKVCNKRFDLVVMVYVMCLLAYLTYVCIMYANLEMFVCVIVCVCVCKKKPM